MDTSSLGLHTSANEEYKERQREVAGNKEQLRRLRVPLVQGKA